MPADTPAPPGFDRRTIHMLTAAQAIARGLSLDPGSRELGFADGFAGHDKNRDAARDKFAYAVGYADGSIERRMQRRGKQEPT